jgi:hypothetical protein
MIERAANTESAAPSERAENYESADRGERAVRAESAEVSERAVTAESVESIERAGGLESAETVERADTIESAKPSERADNPESAEQKERPRYAVGYPRIEVPSHDLWEAQQTGWPDHLPHEAWQALIKIKNTEPKQHTSSADHPAFRVDYAPNYLATEEHPSEQYVANRQERARR